MYPGEVFLVLLMLKSYGYRAKALVSGITLKQRAELQADFNSPKKHSIQVLLISHQMQTEGLNLHAACPNAHLFNEPFGEPIKQQAIGRTYRFGQTRPVMVIKYDIIGTFSAKRIKNNLNKHIPQLVAEFNHTIFSQIFRDLHEEMNEEEGDDEVGEDAGIDLETWFKVLSGPKSGRFVIGESLTTLLVEQRPKTRRVTLNKVISAIMISLYSEISSFD